MVPDPIATYRFQLTPDLGFADVVELLDHVERMGFSHVYLSPIAEAVPGSTHGYDVVDHTRVRDELGGASGFERLLDALAARGMAAIVDHVPNHVAATRPELNPPWWALLRHGPGSAAADWFDVDWDLADGRVILPILGAPVDEVIAAGGVVVEGGDLVVHGERRLPLAPGTATLPLTELLERQHYRLQWWRHPDRNVRRFFTIDDLVAVRVEHEHVAEAVDTIPSRYAGRPGFGGVRVDHVDGLADPAAYLAGLRDRIGADALLYVEKIVIGDETLPAGWPVDGTTGYEFIRTIDHVLLSADAEPAFTAHWRALAGDPRDFSAFEHAARVEVITGALAPDLERVVRVAVGALPDVERAVVADEVRRLTLELPRYRTYLPGDTAAAGLVAAISDGPVARAILDPVDDAQRELRTRWQQLTGPVMAKAAEDRAFYRYLRLPSLSEVGGDPSGFGCTVDEFHADNAARQEHWPRALLAASTHDTKRSEDVRARSTALTWLGTEALDRATADVAVLVERTGLDPVSCWLAWHTAVCTPGVDADRLHAYLVKSAREAAVHTSWEEPDDDHERRLRTVAELVANEPVDVDGLDAGAPGIALVATALRLTVPGVPDVYQGSEAFTHRLVDPDNRVPPDWGVLAGAAAVERTVAALWAEADEAVKPVLVRTLLGVRRRHREAFGSSGTYRPIETDMGAIAYARGDAERERVVVVGRRGLATVAGEISLPDGRWYDVLDPDAPTLTGTVPTASVVGSGTELTLPLAVFEPD